jgi:hypothetical protein
MRPTLFRYAARNIVKPYLYLILGLLFVSNAALAGVEKQGLALMPLETEKNNCGVFVYPEKGDEKNHLIFATDELGEDVTRGWVNLGSGDVELKKVSYQKDNKGISFVFEGKGIRVSFKGSITSPSTETQEYDLLSGVLSVNQKSNKKQFQVVARIGC